MLQPERSLAHSPLFQVMFAWQNAAEGKLGACRAGGASRCRSAPHVVAKFDLTLSLQEAGERIVGGLEYATSLFERRRSSVIWDTSAGCWKAMVADDSQAVDRLPMLAARSGDQVLYEWNETEAEYPQRASASTSCLRSR